MSTLLRSNYDPKMFEKSSPALAYFLGFFWGDGYLYHAKTKSSVVVSIEILKADLDSLWTHFESVCKWNRLNVRKKLSKNVFSRIYSADRSFYTRLVSLGYGDKLGNHEGPLSFLSKEHHRYFFRGLLDSDGSIGRYKGYCVLQIASGFDQNWGSLERLCQYLGVRYTVVRAKKSRGNFSEFTVASQKHFFRLLDHVYQNADSDGIYLPRKYRLYLEIKRCVSLGVGNDVRNRDFT